MERVATSIPADAAWLHSRDLRAVMAALGTGHCRVVGGAVRDALLGRAVRDVDIATDHQPRAAIKRLKAAGIKVVPTGIAHGTITAVVDGRPFEVTSLRHDVETDGRHARVAFHSDWPADAARRDFTFNALYADADGAIHDYFGGRRDLAAGRVRFIGDAAERISEDALRILRFFRFYAWYGKGAVDADGLEACRDNREKLDILSVERVRDELLKLLAAPDPAPVLELMRGAGVLAHILPEVDSAAGLDAGLERLVALERAIDDVAPLRRMAALLGRDRAALARTGARMKLSNADAGRLAAMAAAMGAKGERLDAGLDAPGMRALVYSVGKQAFVDRALLDNGAESAGEVAALIEAAGAFDPPVFPISGHDLEAAGIAPGPAMGKAMRALEEAWIASDFTVGKEALLELLAAK